MTKVEQKLEFKILEIKKISHFEKDFHEYDLLPSDIKDGSMNLNLNLNFNHEEELVIFTTSINCYTLDKTNLLFGIESVYKYKIKGLNKNFWDEKKESYELPKPLMGILVGAAISGTRGMMAALNTTPEYQKIYLPIVSTEKFIDDLKNNN